MMNIIKSAINDYIQTVSNKYNIPLGELQQLMEIPANNNGTIKVVAHPPPQQQPPLVVVEGQACKHIYLRGVKAGSICTNKKKKDGEFCSQHSVKKKAETTIVLNNNDVATEAPKKPNPILRMNKIINKWWHPDTCLVFKSSEEKIVIGIYKNDSICDLSEDDVKTCVAYKFKYVMKRKREEEKEGEQDVLILDKEKVDDKQVPDIIQLPKMKKQKKLPAIDKEFIKVNQTAKNVEVLIKEMFDNKVSQDEEDEDDGEEVIEDEEEEPAQVTTTMIWSGGAEESKDNNNLTDEDINDEVEEEEEEEMLFEEED